MPASQVMKKFHKGQLHSGSKRGKVVTDPKQAKAIQISEARDEGHDIPQRGKAARNKRLGGAKL
jgi:Family of unknown function (DUF6496)